MDAGGGHGCADALHADADWLMDECKKRKEEKTYCGRRW